MASHQNKDYTVIREQLDYGMLTGQTTRVNTCPICLHQNHSSIGACQITREANGFRWYCYRCSEGGMIYDKGMGPKDVLKRLQAIERANNTRRTRSAYIKMPFDCVDTEVPDKFQTWLWKYDFEVEDLIAQHGVRYSPDLDRLVFPVKGCSLIKSENPGELDGWAGRSETKPYVPGKNPKWLIRRAERIDNLIWALEGPKDPVVIVEDILSALRCNQAGYNAVSLIKSFLPPELLLTLRGRMLIIWLDPDVKKKIIRTVARARAFGVTVRSMVSKDDPKAYTPEDIIKKVQRII
jgi:hypothetical protein